MSHVLSGLVASLSGIWMTSRSPSAVQEHSLVTWIFLHSPQTLLASRTLRVETADLTGPSLLPISQFSPTSWFHWPYPNCAP